MTGKQKPDLAGLVKLHLPIAPPVKQCLNRRRHYIPILPHFHITRRHAFRAFAHSVFMAMHHLNILTAKLT